ncbi:MAG: PDR/VanB family oxidoreductase, partial [Pseudomonadota bacterium]
KTCPWNLEGLFAEAPFRWLASYAPGLAKPLARLDDAVGNGSINPIKKWWWDLEMVDEGPYTLTSNGVNDRNLQTDLDLKHEDQTLAVYPANLAPHPYPFPFPMDREAGIKAYEEMLSPATYKARLAAGETEGLAHEYRPLAGSEAPVLRVAVAKAEEQTADVTKYELRALKGEALPSFEAGAHIDVVVAPEYLRQYSLASDPADPGKYDIGVLREDGGRGGSALLHRIFQEGRKVFISRPINHFPLEEEATKSFLMGGGIGITPMIAMAHRLHALGQDFELHYSCRSRASAGFLADLMSVPWVANAHFHFSAEGSRADLPAIIGNYVAGHHIYTCGPDAYMAAVLNAGEQGGFPEEALHREYFSIPEAPDYENHPFTLRLKRSGEDIVVPTDKSAADVLIEKGYPVDLKCSDGICGVCKCGLVSGEVEHRDFVLSKAQREASMILCQSRAAGLNGVVEIDL